MRTFYFLQNDKAFMKEDATEISAKEEESLMNRSGERGNREAI